MITATTTRRALRSTGSNLLLVWCLSVLPLGTAGAGDGLDRTTGESGSWDVARALDSTMDMRDAGTVHPWDNCDYADTAVAGDAGSLRRIPKSGLPPTRQLAPPELYRTSGAPIVPDAVTALTNSPNPFNARTRIAFTLRAAGDVELSIYNLIGQQVRIETFRALAAGTHTWTWDGQSARGETVPSGVYFYRVATPLGSAIQKMVLLK